MWRKQNSNQQAFQSKYSKIVITQKQPYFIDQSNSYLITTNPFSSEKTQNQPQPIVYIQSSQQNKSLESTQLILSKFHKNNLTRNSKVYIKGGGMLLDLASFASSIYMRGIKNITYIPTTLLAMVDATIGGKTGINFKRTKNNVGNIIGNSFNIQVLIYIPYLYTLQKREFLNGMAQVIKMAITYDQEFFKWLESQQITIQKLFDSQIKYNLIKKIVKRSLQIKMKVVEEDLNQKYQRKWLNFGHTFAHGIQLSTGNQYKHGQCVSLGMIKACQIAKSKGILKNNQIIQRLKKVLKKFQLPTQISSHLDKNQIIQLMLHDKKNTNYNQKGKQIQFVMIQDIGKKVMSGTTKVKQSQLINFIGESISIKYPLKPINQNINNQFYFPGSKSISLRMLFISCIKYMINGQLTKVSNFLSSQDTQCMIFSLQAMGFKFESNEQQKWIKILGRDNKIKKGKLFVGNSGITTRFILPFCCLIEGQWKIQCVKRMSERPNQTIINICKQIFRDNVEFNFLKNENTFPLTVKAKDNINLSFKKIFSQINQQTKQFQVPSKQSSQFLSALMINSFLINKENSNQISQNDNSQYKISFKSMKDIKGNLVSQSYIRMTIKCLQLFGLKVVQKQYEDHFTFQINLFQHKQSKNKQFKEQNVQTDLSTLSYPFTLAYLLQIQTPKIPQNSIQGDKQFYQYLNHLNFFNPEILNIQVGLPIIIDAAPMVDQFIHNHLTYDFNNCTDTFMTMAVFLAKKIQGIQNYPVHIANISNQRVKQSNRIFMTIKNLKKIGMKIEEYDDKIIVNHGFDQQYVKSQKRIIFQTSNDHRLAMSMGILSVYLSKKFPDTQFVIDNKKCVEKTFPQFWQYLHQLGCQIKGYEIQKEFKYETFKKQQLTSSKKSFSPIFLIGNRGCGKTLIGLSVAKNMNKIFIDLDDEITKQIKSQSNNQINHIKGYIQKYSWGQFRQFQSQILQKHVNISYDKQCIIGTGGGILQRLSNRQTLKKQHNTIYLQRRFENLIIQYNENRPLLDNFEQISKKRQQYYQDVCNFIINLPGNQCNNKQAYFVQNMIKRALSQSKQIENLRQGYILCLNKIPNQENQYCKDILNDKNNLISQISAVQLRIDQILYLQQKQNNDKNLLNKSMFNLRQSLSKYLLSSQFQKLSSLPLILTLRTLQQYGKFQSNQRYFQMMNKIRKIPCNFLDHEIRFFNNGKFPNNGQFKYDLNKIIWSHHGSNLNQINKLQKMKKGLKKLCIASNNKNNNKDKNLYQQMKQKMDICVNLNDKISRFDNKYQMVVPNPIPKQLNKTGIYSINEMKILKNVIKMLK